MSDNLVEARELRKVHRTNGVEFEALTDVNLNLRRGEFVAIMGQSGSGKSTLLHLLAGLDQPTGGEVLFEGQSLAGKSEKALAVFRRKHVGFIYQFFHLIESMSCLDNIILPALLMGVSPAEAKRRAAHLLERLGIGGVEAKVPGALSGGQRQRVAIARALINEPPLLLADEPTGSLDSRSGDEVLSVLTELHEQGITILLVTHDARVASRADRVMFMQDGQTVDEATFTSRPDPQRLLARVLQVGG